jgi:hypothetical protein
MHRSKTNGFNVRNAYWTRPSSPTLNSEGSITMNNRTTTPRPTREDMLAFVANGRPLPTAEWAICRWYDRKPTE